MACVVGRPLWAALVLVTFAAAASDLVAPGPVVAPKRAGQGVPFLRNGTVVLLGEDVASTTKPHEEKKDKQEDTTSPPSPEVASGSPPSILVSIVEVIGNQLQHAKYQELVALVALVFGIVMVLDGESVFKWLVIGAVTIVACIMAKNEAVVIWELNEDSHVGDMVGIEVGALFAWASYVGIDGVMLLVGALFGGLVAECAHEFLVAHVLTFLANRWAHLVFFTAVIAFAIYLFHRKGHLTGLAILSPAVGGALVSSATCYFVTDLATHKLMGWFAQHNLHPEGGNWINFLALLVRGPSPDVGLFAGSAHNPTVLDGRVPIDRILGCVLWLLVFFLGAVQQLRKDKERKLMGKTTELNAPLLG